jgi:hypothetical protein
MRPATTIRREIRGGEEAPVEVEGVMPGITVDDRVDGSMLCRVGGVAEFPAVPMTGVVIIGTASGGCVAIMIGVGETVLIPKFCPN